MGSLRARREIVNEGPEESRVEKRSVSLILEDHLRVPLRVATGKGVSSGILLLDTVTSFDIALPLRNFLSDKAIEP